MLPLQEMNSRTCRGQRDNSLASRRDGDEGILDLTIQTAGEVAPVSGSPADVQTSQELTEAEKLDVRNARARARYAMKNLRGLSINYSSVLRAPYPMELSISS